MIACIPKFPIRGILSIKVNNRDTIDGPHMYSFVKMYVRVCVWGGVRVWLCVCVCGVCVCGLCVLFVLCVVRVVCVVCVV